MPNYTLKTEIGDGGVPVTIEFEYFPSTPGKTSGPMEDCYPPEEYTIEVCEINVGGWYIIDLLSDSWEKAIEELCVDYVASIGEA